MVQERDERKIIQRELQRIEQEMKELEVRYEQYFAGVEKREPMQDREKLARRLRQFANRRIMQTNLRFKYQTLASRFHTYAGNWDRILRLIEEGKYARHTERANGAPRTPKTAAASRENQQVDTVLHDLVAAQKACRIDAPPPNREQVAGMLARQKEMLREKYGDREVEFRVVTEGGKPKIKVRALDK